MKNIQIIDGAENATFSVSQATEEEFAAIFPDGRDMELSENFFERLGNETASAIAQLIWSRPIPKRDAKGIHGTLLYNYAHRRDYIPPSKREVDQDVGALNQAQQELFAKHR